MTGWDVERKPPVRVAVTGGRKYPNKAHVFWVLGYVHYWRGITALAHGATPTGEGADWHADTWAKAHNVPVTPFRADPVVDGQWPAAGPRRNRRMLETFRPDGLIAFPGDRGTANCVMIAKSLGIPVWEVRP